MITSTTSTFSLSWSVSSILYWYIHVHKCTLMQDPLVWVFLHFFFKVWAALQVMLQNKYPLLNLKTKRSSRHIMVHYTIDTADICDIIDSVSLFFELWEVITWIDSNKIYSRMPFILPVLKRKRSVIHRCWQRVL